MRRKYSPNNPAKSSIVSRRGYALAGLAMALATANVSHAQADFEKGFQAYQSYHGSDFDVVNLANGNLVLNIPLLSYEQRGGLPPVTISIRSNSTTFQSTPPYVSGPLDTQQHEVASGVIGSPWGQPHVVIDPGGLSWKESRIVTSSHTGNGGPEYLTRFVALDESGATHSLGGAIANLAAGLVENIRYSVDGSGLMLQPGSAPAGQLIVDRAGLTGGLIDTNGNAITLNGQCSNAPGTGDLFNASLASWEGYAHGTASAVSLVDSIGRVIPNPSHMPAAVPYSCIVDLDASYHPASPDANGCETWKFPGEAGSLVPFVFCYKQIPISAVIPIPIAPGSPSPGGGVNTQACKIPVLGGTNTYSCETINETWWVLSSVTLPNQTQWSFTYDNYGQVQTVTMPTGATITYSYQMRLACGNPPGQIPVSGTPVWPYSNIMSTRWVTSRTLDPKDGTTETWNYANTIGSGWASSPNSGTVTVTDPANNDTVHTFALQGQCVCGPYETKTQYYQGPKSAGVLLKEVDTTYTTTGTDYANPTNFSDYISVGVFPKTVTTSLPTTATSVVESQETYNYDELGTYQDYVGITHPFSFGQVMSSTESDWGTGAPGPVLKTTLHTHLWQSDWTYYATNLIDIPCLDTVFTGAYSGIQPSCAAPTAPAKQASQTSYGYDESAYSYTGSLGNATSVNHWLSGSNAAISTHNVYTASSHGMPTQKIDAKGNATLITYDSTGIFPNKIQHPSTSTWGVTTAHIEQPSYDASTGLLESNLDENSQLTKYTYDPMRRLTYTTFPDLGWESYTYTDTTPTPSFSYSRSINNGETYTAIGIADGLGRINHTQVTSDVYDGFPSVIYKDTTYDSLGRVASVSNPYRGTSDTTYGVTSYLYDALNRKTFQCQQDNTPIGATTCAPSNSYLQWVYSGKTTTSYDELRNAWLRTSDGLGRLTSVVEPGGLNTSYSYDVLGNLLCADQWGASAASSACTSARVRQFSYDSVSRLITSYNPETGTICYGQWSGTTCAGGYDLNSNLLAKTDARGITTQYTYDALNRLLTKSYLNDTTGTAASCFQYDVSSLASPGANLIGRMTNAWTQAGGCPQALPTFPSSVTLSLRSVLAYDPMGRVLSEQQCTASNCAAVPYPVTYDYDLAGNLIHHTNGISSGPHALQFTNCYDTANRLSLVVGTNTQCAAPTYTPLNTIFSLPSYSPAGGLTMAGFGTGLQLSRIYDVRLRIGGELDTGGNTQQTRSSATVQVMGKEQTK